MSTPVPQAGFDDVIQEYQRREPAGADSWNPLGNEQELWHRVRLMVAMRWALAQIPGPIAKMKILDVGCGVGRSTRGLLELGASPPNVLGIDVRPDALEFARTLNPAIGFEVVSGVDDWPAPGSFDVCMQCTAFSSIPGNERREDVAAAMERAVHASGYVFWWDLLRANPFAGGDELQPQMLFKNCTLVASQRLALPPIISEALRPRRRLIQWFGGVLQRCIGFAPTHCAALLRKNAPRP